MNSGSNTESYPAFAHIGLRENPGKNLNQVTCPDRESNPGHLVSRPDALTNSPEVHSASYKIEYRVFPGGKRRSERGADHSTSFLVPCIRTRDRDLKSCALTGAYTTATYAASQYNRNLVGSPCYTQVGRKPQGVNCGINHSAFVRVIELVATGWP
ncbi:hypothetical protein ANN_02698 [Periplaneta americana]|uniref:Uncharacterized protein n=1 Tax=Periplaneta americana TaxID=6978 RepID=A0ABQ8TYR0_PERAM|nr:hypothetical protein ANN_02698 [Periplaneta americana]